MIIGGRFIGDAPYFVAHLRSPQFQGLVWLLADTGASRTTLLDRDVRLLGIPTQALEPALLPLIGIGGSVRSFVLRNVELTFASDEGDGVLQQDPWVVQHDLDRLPPEEVSRILRLPSVMGRDLINRFHFVCDYQAGTVNLERR
ncbi:hypothetical protein HKBW3S09_00770 [Candidatus Hakubella thermalkaliphila]|uniref:Peptidase A2 domain-containing protein n=1 Tax=Candidatus Hakubella thermalkaliphila TaxID=2754717 RepID=A0A6V8NTD1_9ACTN|nr:hypothetical protein HKBW3S09_00770 [Candidatus Hakubella thermalkaliphila]